MPIAYTRGMWPTVSTRTDVYAAKENEYKWMDHVVERRNIYSTKSDGSKVVSMICKKTNQGWDTKESTRSCSTATNDRYRQRFFTRASSSSHASRCLVGAEDYGDHLQDETTGSVEDTDIRRIRFQRWLQASTSTGRAGEVYEGSVWCDDASFCSNDSYLSPFIFNSCSRKCCFFISNFQEKYSQTTNAITLKVSKKITNFSLKIHIEFGVLTTNYNF